MPKIAIAHVTGTIVTVAQLSGGHDTKGAGGRERTALGSSQRVFAVARIMDHFAVTPARQVDATRKHLTGLARAVPRITIALGPSGVVPIAMIGAVTCVVPVVVAFTFVMRPGRGTWAPSERQPVVIVIPIALVAVAVAWVALIAVIAGMEVHRASAKLKPAVLVSDAGLRRMCA